MCAAGTRLLRASPRRGRGPEANQQRESGPAANRPRHDADPTPWDELQHVSSTRWPFLFPSPDASASRARLGAARVGVVAVVDQERAVGQRTGACGDRRGGIGDPRMMLSGSSRARLRRRPQRRVWPLWVPISFSSTRCAARRIPAPPSTRGRRVGRDQPDVAALRRSKVTSRRRRVSPAPSPAVSVFATATPPSRSAWNSSPFACATRPRTRLPRGAPGPRCDDGHVRVRPLREPSDLARWFMPHSMAA